MTSERKPLWPAVRIRLRAARAADMPLWEEMLGCGLPSVNGLSCPSRLSSIPAHVHPLSWDAGVWPRCERALLADCAGVTSSSIVFEVMQTKPFFPENACRFGPLNSASVLSPAYRIREASSGSYIQQHATI